MISRRHIINKQTASIYTNIIKRKDLYVSTFVKNLLKNFSTDLDVWHRDRLYLVWNNIIANFYTNIKVQQMYVLYITCTCCLRLLKSLLMSRYRCKHSCHMVAISAISERCFLISSWNASTDLLLYKILFEHLGCHLPERLLVSTQN